MLSANKRIVILAVVLAICLSFVLCVSAAPSSNVKDNLKADAKATTTGWEVTLQRQKLRAEALASEFGAVVEYAARRVLGSHYTNVYSSWTSFAWRIAPLLSQARVHIYTAVKYIGHLTAKLEATILDLTTSNRSSLGEYANHLESYAATAAKVIVGLGAVVIIAFLNSLLGRRRRA